MFLGITFNDVNRLMILQLSGSFKFINIPFFRKSAIGIKMFCRHTRPDRSPRHVPEKQDCAFYPSSFAIKLTALVSTTIGIFDKAKFWKVPNNSLQS